MQVCTEQSLCSRKVARHGRSSIKTKCNKVAVFHTCKIHYFMYRHIQKPECRYFFTQYRRYLPRSVKVSCSFLFRPAPVTSRTLGPPASSENFLKWLLLRYQGCRCSGGRRRATPSCWYRWSRQQSRCRPAPHGPDKNIKINKVLKY